MSTTPDRHVLRAEAMAETGARPAARAYLLTLASQAAYRAVAARQNLRNDHDRDKRAQRHQEQGAMYLAALARLGLAPVSGIVDLAAELASAEAVLIPAKIDGLTFSHAVANPFWAGVGWYGIDLRIDDRTAQKRGLWVECHVYPPDAERSQLTPARRAETRPEALVLAGRWVTLGFAVLAAESTLQARAGVVAPVPAEVRA